MYLIKVDIIKWGLWWQCGEHDENLNPMKIFTDKFLIAAQCISDFIFVYMISWWVVVRWLQRKSFHLSQNAEMQLLLHDQQIKLP